MRAQVSTPCWLPGVTCAGTRAGMRRPDGLSVGGGFRLRRSWSLPQLFQRVEGTADCPNGALCCGNGDKIAPLGQGEGAPRRVEGRLLSSA